MRGVSKIFLFLAAGELIVDFANLPLPGAMLALAMMLGDFLINGRPDPEVAAIFDTVSRHFVVLFAPAGAGVLAYGAVLGPSMPVVVLAVLGGTAVTMIVTAAGMSLVLGRRNRRSRSTVGEEPAS